MPKFPAIDITDRADDRIIYWDDTAGIHKYRDEAAAAGGAFVGAKLTRSTSKALTSATMTAVDFDTETYDTDGFHEGVTNPTRLTVPTGKDGYYLIHAQVSFGASSAADRIVRIRKNGNDATDLAYLRTPVAQSASNPTRMEINAIALLAATDYVELIVYTGGTGTSLEASTAAATPGFSMSRLGT